MAAEIILIKHAMPVILEGVPSKDWVLGREGRTAAAALAEKLRPRAPAALVASPEPKALETGRILAGAFGLDVQGDEGLVETRRETVPFLPREALEAGIQRFFNQPADLVFGEETADVAHARFAAALDRHRGQRPLVVACHGTVISLYVSRHTGADPMSLWRSLTLPHALVLGEDGRVIDSIGSE